MRRAVSLVLAVLVAACSSPPAGRLFTTSLPTDGYAPLPVVLGDETGLVSGIEPGPAGATAPSLEARADPAGPNGFVVGWMGGLCSSDVALSFKRTASGFAVHLEVHDKVGSCPMVGISRDVRVKTTAPISIESIEVTGSD